MSVMPTDLMSNGQFESSSFTMDSSDLSADTEGLTSFTANLKSQKDEEKHPNLLLQGQFAHKVGTLDFLNHALSA